MQARAAISTRIRYRLANSSELVALIAASHRIRQRNMRLASALRG